MSISNCRSIALGVVGLALGATATLQAAEKPDDTLAEVTVTGTRIANPTGMTTPTPVTAVTAEELSILSPGTLVSALSQLPQFYGNTNNDVRTGFFSSPGSGNLNLRGLNTGGSGRTLTLLDGRRVVPANGFGSVDINILPQTLIKRVDTVTGGASAAYGTDAVAGAVNFILDTGYTGWQARMQWGSTEQSDRENINYALAWGGDLGERVHVLASAEYYHANQIDNLYARDWYQGYSLFNNPAATTANPNAFRYLKGANVVSSISTFGGLINSGVPTTSALYRRYFNPNGTLSPFVTGLGTTTQAQSITNGGSGDDTTGDLQALAPEAQRANAFLYMNFDATDHLNFFIQGLAGQSMIDQPDHGGRFAGVAGIDTRITIYRENAFLPAAVRQIMVNENLQSFQMNLTGDREGLGRESRVKQDNNTYSGTVGFKWDITQEGLLNGWQVDGYAQYGTASNKGFQQGILLNRIAAATDAIADPANPGKIVCRAATINPSKWGGCVPINLFGRGNASDAAIAYVTEFTPDQKITSPLFFQPDGYDSGKTVTFNSGLGKVYNTTTQQSVADLTLSGKVWDGWAGPINTALGMTYRKEEILQIVFDPSNPASDPNIFPAAGDPALRGVPPYTLTRSSMIQNSTVANVHGNYNVREAFTEWQVPLLAGLPGAEHLDLLAAARYADYSGSGGVWSWKTGLNWQVIEDVRLRGTVSRDVRAATLLERYNQTGGVGSVTKDPAFPNDGTQNFGSRTGGNPNLDPEVSNTKTYGIVYQPRWLEGFSISGDYWDVEITDAIGTLGFQGIVDGCYAGIQTLCSLVTRDPTTNRLVQVKNISVNIGAAAGRGVDMEMEYHRPIDLFRSGGEAIAARVFWSHLMENSTTSDRSKPVVYPNYVDSAGQTGVGVLPEDAITGTLTYTAGAFNTSVTARYISDGTLNVRYNLPGARPDVEDNTVPSVVYVNLGAGYSWKMGGGTLELYGDVQNLLDKDPPVVPGVFDTSLAQTGSQYNAGLFDLLGRRYSLGLRYRH